MVSGFFFGRTGHMEARMTKDWKTRTKLVHEGSRRSQYGEMAEAIFLTQGFAYPTAESAEERFIKAGDDEFIYARYGNPTTRMFEDRIAALEGTEDAFSDLGLDTFGRPRLGGIGDIVTREIEARTGIETRNTTLGHIQRGGTPSAYDRVLATRYGLAAIDAVVHERWGRMVSLRGTEVTHVSIDDALGKLNTVPQARYDEASILFG